MHKSGSYYTALHHVTLFMLAAANIPLAVLASQSAMSILVSWSPPADAYGGAEITGYRIYYTYGGVLMNVKVSSTERQHQLDLDGDLPDDMIVNIRAESSQLPSELFTVTINTEVLTTTVEEYTIATIAKQSDAPTTETSLPATLPLTTASTASIGDTMTTKYQLSTTDIHSPSEST